MLLRSKLKPQFQTAQQNQLQIYFCMLGCNLNLNKLISAWFKFLFDKFIMSLLFVTTASISTSFFVCKTNVSFCSTTEQEVKNRIKNARRMIYSPPPLSCRHWLYSRPTGLHVSRWISLFPVSVKYWSSCVGPDNGFLFMNFLFLIFYVFLCSCLCFLCVFLQRLHGGSIRWVKPKQL